jgi:hypothetical protein
MMDIRELTAPCGIDCFNCEVYEKNCTDQIKDMLAEAMKIDREKVPCAGCRAQNGCRLHWNECATLDCVKEKGVDFCFECGEFPCQMLAPSRESAERYPHNMKVYNLCRMKLLGIDKWADEAKDIRMRYFKGKFVVGKGPVL